MPNRESAAKTQKLLEEAFQNDLLALQKERDHQLPDCANFYLAGMLAAQVQFVPKLPSGDRAFFRGVESTYKLAEGVQSGVRASTEYRRVAERLLFMLTYAREHVVYRELFRGDVSVSTLESVAQRAFSLAIADTVCDRGLQYTANNYFETQQLLRSLFFHKLQRGFTNVHAEVSLIAMPYEL